MTIGIAAYGPDAGRAVLRALAAVEAVGRGAIGGFVSAVALSGEGEVLRAETQRGGTATLFGDDAKLAKAFAEARIAAVMSSGPDRPAPLRQFTPARTGVGLVTGHRMPNTMGASGLALNEEVLELMSSGLSPQEAVERVTKQNPDVDAGLIALSADGRIYMADTVQTQQRADRGSWHVALADGSAVAGAMHNAILPHRPLAMLATEVALDVMAPRDRPTGWITLVSGTPLSLGSANAVHADAAGAVNKIVVSNPKFLAGRWNLGVGLETPVISHGRSIAVMLYEPYMIAGDGRIESVDGKDTLIVPIRST
ncbi:MAG TPA: hypothetical protein VHB74_02790 [Devosia sp.]|nr:hypothetical protein [Devosia sp.]